jgi:hypothetical protein
MAGNHGGKKRAGEKKRESIGWKKCRAAVPTARRRAVGTDEACADG